MRSKDELECSIFIAINKKILYFYFRNSLEQIRDYSALSALPEPPDPHGWRDDTLSEK